MRVVLFAKPGGKDPLPKEFEFGYVSGELGGKLAVITPTPARFGKSTLPTPDEAQGVVLVAETQVATSEEIETTDEAMAWGNRLVTAYEGAAAPALEELQKDMRQLYFQKLAEAADEYLRQLDEANKGV